MEADWEVEIGGDAPVIDACWEGLLDLRRRPDLALTLPESRQLAGLAEALIQLNSAASPVWTSKCDVWRPDEFAPDEMGAREEESNQAMACYVDLLPLTDEQWPTPEQAVGACRSICLRISKVALCCCRTDLIVRSAWTAADHKMIGITAYLTACGPTLDQATAVLASALKVFVEAIVPDEHTGIGSSSLQWKSAGE